MEGLNKKIRQEELDILNKELEGVQSELESRGVDVNMLEQEETDDANIPPPAPIKTKRETPWKTIAALAGIGFVGTATYYRTKEYDNKNTKKEEQILIAEDGGEVKVNRGKRKKIEGKHQYYSDAVRRISKMIGLDNPKMSRKEVINKFGITNVLNAFIKQEGGPKLNKGNITIPPSGLLPGQRKSGRFLRDGNGNIAMDYKGNPVEFADYESEEAGIEALRKKIEEGYKPDESFEDFVDTYTYGDQVMLVMRKRRASQGYLDPEIITNRSSEVTTTLPNRRKEGEGRKEAISVNESSDPGAQPSTKQYEILRPRTYKSEKTIIGHDLPALPEDKNEREVEIKERLRKWGYVREGNVWMRHFPSGATNVLHDNGYREFIDRSGIKKPGSFLEEEDARYLGIEMPDRATRKKIEIEKRMSK